MLVLNCSDKPIVLMLPSRAPIVFGAHETVFAPRTITLPPKEPVQLSDTDAAVALAMRGPQGVVTPLKADGAEVVQDETVEMAYRRGREQRLRFLMKQVIDYRRLQAQKAAAGIAIDLPPESLRAMMPEITKLREELVKLDPVMTEVLPDLAAKPVPDPLKEDMAAMGFPASAAPMVPRVPDLLSEMASS